MNRARTRWKPASAGVIALWVLSACGSGGGNEATTFSAGFDVRGASNSACTLTVRNGNASVDFMVAPPAPPVADTSLAPQVAVRGCDPNADGAQVAAAMSDLAGHPTASRTSASLCVSSDALMTILGFSATSTPDCPVTVTLTCGGVVLYDAVPWQACTFLG